MPNFHVTYASSQPLPDDDAVVAEVMRAWERWFTELGPAVVDGGAMLAPGAVVGPDRTITHATGRADGYSVIAAADLDDAVAKVRGCPVLDGGGSVRVSECVGA